MTDVKSLSIEELRSAVADLPEQQLREVVAASFFADHALPVVEGNLCTQVVRFPAQGHV